MAYCDIGHATLIYSSLSCSLSLSELRYRHQNYTYQNSSISSMRIHTGENKYTDTHKYTLSLPHSKGHTHQKNTHSKEQTTHTHKTSKQGAGQVCAASQSVSPGSGPIPWSPAHSREKPGEEEPGGPSKVHPQRTSLRLKPPQLLSPLSLSLHPPSHQPTREL